MMPGRGGIKVGFITNLLAWVIPIVVVLAYFFLEWRLAKRGREPKLAA
jgi:cytochrome c-type biogenesis protein CcmH/NrfF